MANISSLATLPDAKRGKGEAKPWAGPASKKLHQLLTGGGEEKQNHDAEDKLWLQLAPGIRLVTLRAKSSVFEIHRAHAMGEPHQNRAENSGLPNLQESRLKYPKYLMLLLHISPLLFHALFSVFCIALCV